MIRETSHVHASSAGQIARICEAVKRAAQRAVRLHRAFNLPMCGWQDGRVVWVSPEDLPCDDPPAEPAAGA